MDQNGNVSQQIVLNAGTLQTGSNAGQNVFGGQSGTPSNTRLQLNGGTLQLTTASSLAYANNVGVAGNVLVLSDRGVAGAGVTGTFGTLSLAGTLFNMNNALSTSGISGLTFGATTLTANSKILTTSLGAGANLITLDSINGTNENLLLGGGITNYVSGGATYGAGNITITNATNLGSGNLTVLDNGGTVTFGGNVATTGTVNLYQGGGTYGVGGSTVIGGAFVGTQSIAVNSGILQLGLLANASGTLDRISDTATLTLAGGNLLVTQLSGTSKESIGTLALGVGFSKISQQGATLGGVGYYYLSFGNLATVPIGATLDFTVVGSGTANGSVQFSGTAPTLTNGIIGGWATAGADFATVSGTGSNVTAYAAYTTGTADFSGSATAINNVQLTLATGTTVTLATSSTINTLKLTTPGAGGIEALNLGGHTLDLGAGGLLLNFIAGTVPTYDILNGILTAGTSSAPAELVNTYAIQYGSQSLYLGATITDNSFGGSVSYVNAGGATSNAFGSSKEYLSGANTYTGNTYLEGGNTYILTNRQFGALPSTLGASKLYLTNNTNIGFNNAIPASLTANRSVVLGGGGGQFTPNSGYGNLDFQISGTGPMTFNNNSAGGFQEIVSGANTYDGQTTISLALAFTSIGNIGGGASSLGAPTTVASGEILLGDYSSQAYVGTGSSVTDRLFIYTGRGYISGNGAGSLTLNGNIVSLNVNDTSFNVGGYGVTVVNGNMIQGEATALNLSKVGVGTVQLNGQNTYQGTTKVSIGALEFNTIGNVGSGASSLGAPTTVANGTINLAGGTLRFTGNTAQSSDRVLNVTANSNLETTSNAPITFVGGVTESTFTLTLGGTGNGYLSGAGIIAGTGGITENGLTGLGVWTLNQSVVNTYSGATTVNAGTLNLDFSNLSTPTNLVNAVSALTLGGGTLGILGKSTGSTSQTFASLTTTADTGSVLNVNGNGGAGTTLSINTGTIGSNSTLDIKTTGAVTVSGTAAQTNGIVLGVTYNETDFASAISGTFGAYSAYTTFTGTDAGSVTANYLLASSTTLTASTQIYGLKIAPGAGSESLDLNGKTLTGSGATTLLFDGSAYAYTILNSNISTGSIGTAANSLYITTAGTHALTVSAALGNTTSTMIKSGAGTLILAGSNNYSGQTDVQTGTLQAGSANGFSKSSTFFVGPSGVLATEGFAPGVLFLSGNGTVKNGAGSDDTLTIGANNTNSGTGFNGGSATFSGMIVDGGAGKLNLVKAGYGAEILSNAYNSMNTYTGSTTVASGILGVYKIDDIGVASSIGAGSSITLGSFGQLGVLQMMVNLTTNNESNRTVTLAAGGAGGIDVQGSGYQTTANGTLWGALTTLSGSITGAGELEKLGMGNLFLSGANNYTGGTIVEQGLLQFTNSASVPASGQITVNRGGTVAAGYAIDQAFLNHINSTSNGVVALGIDSAQNLDFTLLPNAALGASGLYTFSGTLTPGSAGYQLGGGAFIYNVNSTANPYGALFIGNANTITGANNLVVSPHGSAGGYVVFDDAQNYTGSTTVSGNFNLYTNVGNSGVMNGNGQSGAYVATGELDVTGSLGTSSINVTPFGFFKVVASAAMPGQAFATTTPINLNGGNFEFVNDGSNIGFALTTGALNLNRGNGMVVTAAASNIGLTSMVTFGSLNRTLGTTIEFVGPGLGGSTNRVNFAGSSGMSNSLASPWASVNTTSAVTGVDVPATDFAILTASGPYAGDITAANGAVITTAAQMIGSDYTISAGGSVSLLASASANTLRVTTTTATILPGSFTLAINGVMNTTTGVTIGALGTTGTVTAMGSTGGEIVFNAATQNAAIVVNTNITDNGGAVRVIQTGQGALTLNGTNSFSGGLFLDNPWGRINVVGTTSGTAAFGSGPITMNGGALITSGFAANTVINNNWIINADAFYEASSNYAGVTLAGSITLNNNANFVLYGNSPVTSKYNGPIQGTGNLVIEGYNSSSLMYLGGTGNNTFTGTTYITGQAAGGASTILSLEKTGTASNPVAISGNIVIGQNPMTNTTPNPYQDVLILNNSGYASNVLSSNQIADTSIINFQGGNGYSAGIFRMNNDSETIGGIQSVGNGDGLVQNNAATAGTSTLTLQTVSGQNTSFSGIIQDHDNSNTNLGKMALTVTGAGTQVLGGVSTYSGTTTVTGSATLIVSGSITSSPVSVNTATATLGGSGAIAQNVTVTNGGQLAPGMHSAGSNYGGPGGTLTLASAGTLTLTSANLDFDLDTTAASSNNDKIATGALSLGSTIVFNFSQLTPGTLEIGQLYTLISANSISGFSAGNISTTWINGTPYTATYSVVGNNNLDVTFTAVPEPGTWVLMLGGFGMLSCFQRIRRNRQ